MLNINLKALQGSAFFYKYINKINLLIVKLKEFYTRDDSYQKYNENILELNDELSCLIMKIEQVLFTNKGEVLGVPEFGCNLDDMIFTLELNASFIKNNIKEQISTYCMNMDSPNHYNVEVEVSFFQNEERNGAIVNVFINEKKVISTLY